MTSFLETIDALRKKPVFVLLFSAAAYCTISVLIYGSESRAMVLIDYLVKSFGFFLLFFVPGFYLLRLINSRYFDIDISFLLAMPATIILFLFSFLLLYPLHSPSISYCLVNFFIVTIILLLSSRKAILKDILNISSVSKSSLALYAFSVIIALAFVTLQVSDPVFQMHGEITTNRGLVRLYSDNYLQFDTMKVFTAHSNPWVQTEDPQWTMGDRPPLFGVLAAVLSLTFLNDSGLTFWDYQILGTVLNATSVIALVYIANKIFPNIKLVITSIFIVVLNIFFFINIYFTWPKFMGGYFVLISIYLLIYKNFSLGSMFLSGLFISLGCLFHNSFVLSIPVYFLVYIFIQYRHRKIAIHRIIISICCFSFAFIAVQFPWIAYKKVHPEIDTYTPSIYYYPEKYHPSYGTHTKKNVTMAYAQFLKDYSLSDQVFHRLGNFATVLNNNGIMDSLQSLLKGHSDQQNPLWDAFFGFPLHVIGGLQLIAFFFAILINCLALMKSRLGHVKTILHNVFKADTFFLLFYCSIISLVFNIFFQWDCVSTRCLPSLELTLLLMLTTCYTIFANILLRYLLILLTMYNFFDYIFTSTAFHKYPIFSFSNIIIIVSVLIFSYFIELFSIKLDMKGK